MDFLNSIFGGGGGGEAAAPAGPAAPASRTSIFEPSGGSGDFNPFALAGRAMGIPTTAERIGGVRGEALSEMGKLVQSGLPPEQAIIQFVQTPKGQQWFGADPDMIGTLQAFRTAVQAPVPQLHSTTPGGQTLGATPGAVTDYGTTPMTPSQMAGKNPPALHNVPGRGGSTDVLRQNPDGSATLVHQTEGSVDTAPGHVQLDARTGAIFSYNQTTKQQDFNYFGNFSGAPASRLREIAEAEITPPELRTDKTERALNNMVANNMITPLQKDQYMTGAWEVKEGKNVHGEPNGKFSIINKIDGTQMPIMPGTRYYMEGGGAQHFPQVQGSTQAPPSPGPGGPARSYTGQRPPAYDQGPTPTQYGNSAVGADPTTGEQFGPNTRGPDPTTQAKNRMFLASGASPAFLRDTAHLWGTLNPAWQTAESREANDQASAMQRLDVAMTNLAADQGTMGVPKTVIETYKTMAGGIGWLSAPSGQAVQKGIQLYDGLIDERRAAVDVLRDPEDIYGKKQKDDAAGRVMKLDAVLRALPDRNTMVELDQAIMKGREGTTAVGAITNAGRQGMQIIRGESPTASPTAPTRAQPNAAITPQAIQTMEPRAVLAIDPSTVPSEGRAAYRKRLEAIAGKPAAAPPATPTARSNFASEDASAPSGALTDFTKDPAAATRGIPQNGQADNPNNMTAEERLNASFDLIGKVLERQNNYNAGKEKLKAKKGDYLFQGGLDAYSQSRQVPRRNK